MNAVRKYVTEFHSILERLPEGLIEQVIDVLHAGRLRQRQVFIMGNGGSASTASHFVCDLSKNTRRSGWPNYRVMGLTDNMALFSALANDDGYENVFSEQLSSYVTPGDIVIGISTSGNSMNVIKAIELANQVGARTIGFTGFDGGRLGGLVDIHVHVPSNCIEQVEDIHLMLEHLICKTLRERIARNQVPAKRISFQSANEIEMSSFTSSVSIHKNSMEAYPTASGKVQSSLESIYSLGRETVVNGPVEDLFVRILESSLKIVDADSGSVVLLDERSDISHTYLAYQGEVRQISSPAINDIFQTGLAKWVIENRQAALIMDTLEDPRWLPSAWDHARSVPRSALAVPLLDGERVTGVLTLASKQMGVFKDDSLVVLSSMALWLSSILLRTPFVVSGD